MNEKLIELDKLLSQMTVSGDNVILLAKSRLLLKDIYEEGLEKK